MEHTRNVNYDFEKTKAIIRGGHSTDIEPMDQHRQCNTMAKYFKTILRLRTDIVGGNFPTYISDRGPS